MLSANPNGGSSQRLDQEKRDIAEGLKLSRHRDSFHLETKTAVRPRDLQRAMLDLNPQIVHFSGQGEAEAGLVFEDESGQPKLIDAVALAGLFKLFAGKLQCVVLNACYSEFQAAAIAQYIPYVIGMSQAIEEREAIEFAVGFYDALGAGRDFEFAYEFGCSAARLNGTADLTPVLKRKLNAAPQRTVTIAPLTLQPFNPAIYSAATWVERSDLTEPLLQILQGNCRVLALTGITGIGKTALAERLISELRDERRFCRLNLDEGGVMAAFSSSGAALLRSLGEEPTLADQQDPQNLLTHVVELLRSHPYRVQIDSMERLLEGDDRQGWSEFCDRLWLELFQQLLAGGECQSQLILTTQDLPGELESVGSRYPQFWQCQAVRGLSAAEQLELFAKRGLSEEGIDYLQRIGRLYEGHPLVLRVIAEDIKACGGNVQRYWQQGKFAELETNRPANLSRRKLQLEVKQRVKDALARLPEDALQLLCRSAVYRRPVPAAFWLALLPEPPETALELLKARALAEEDWEKGAWLGVDGEIPLRQHNVVRSVAYELLKTDPALWQTTERTAAEQWLNHYEAIPEALNLEQVRGSLEAFDHYCDVEDWMAAKAILVDQNIGLNLQTWGHYQEMIVLYGKLANRLSATDEVIRRKSLGNAYYLLSQYKPAIDYYQQSLDLARELSDRSGQWKALNNLGNVYRSLGDYPKSIEYLEQTLSIAREIGDRRGEGNALGNLGLACHSLGKYPQAIEFHQQRLAISREIGNRQGEGNALCNLGITYSSSGNYPQAIEYHQQALAIAREIGDRRGEGQDLGNLGNAYNRLGNYPQAIEYHQQALAIAREIGDRQGEGAALGSLGNAYDSLGDYPQAIEFHQQSLAIAREIGDRLGESIALVNWGQTLTKLEQYSEALEPVQVSLEIFREIGSREGESEALLRLAELHQKLGSIELARQECDRALEIAIELGIPLVKECEILKQQLEEENNDRNC
jgi:tetratricopeptide (TPR) repeat protein